MVSLSGLFSPVAKFFRELINGPDLNVVGIPVDEFTSRKAAEQARFRDGLAHSIHADLTTLFAHKDNSSLGFSVAPVRELYHSDQRAGLRFGFDLPDLIGQTGRVERMQAFTELHPAHVCVATGATCVKPLNPLGKTVKTPGHAPATKAARPPTQSVVNLQDPDTKVLAIHNGRDNRPDSLLFVHKGGVIISVAKYGDHHLTSALVQSRELHPAVKIHPLHPENTPTAVAECTRQIHGKYVSHLAGVGRLKIAPPVSDAPPPPQIIVPPELLPAALPSTAGPAHFRDVAPMGTPLLPSHTPVSGTVQVQAGHDTKDPMQPS